MILLSGYILSLQQSFFAFDILSYPRSLVQGLGSFLFNMDINSYKALCNLRISKIWKLI